MRNKQIVTTAAIIVSLSGICSAIVLVSDRAIERRRIDDLLFGTACGEVSTDELFGVGDVIYPKRELCWVGKAVQSHNSAFCQNITTYQVRKVCFSEVAASKNDLAICDHIFGPDNPLLAAAQGECYAGVAFKDGEPMICNELVDGYARTRCEQTLASPPRMTDLFR